MKEKVASKPKNLQSVTRNSRSHRALALKAADEAERVLIIFEKEHPHDARPRQAIEAIRAWAQGKRELGMAEVRQLSLDSHAAARGAKSDAARFAARAAGQAVATWHVPTHALAVPAYVGKAIAANKNKTPKKRDLTPESIQWSKNRLY
ncbi:MAG: putative immunity protein [Patescibacteria group bacterium]